MPCGAPLVRKVDQTTEPFGVMGLGVNAKGARVVPHGWPGSPQSGNADVSTTPVNEAFFVTFMLTALSRFWFVLIVVVVATVYAKSGMLWTVPEYTAARISSPGL